MPKTLTGRREGDRWRITVFCDNVPEMPLESTEAVVRVDVGVTELVATSTGELYGNPRHLRRSLQRLAGNQRLVAGRKRGSNRRRKAARHVGRLHRRLANQRRDVAHQISRQLVDPAPRPNDEGGFDPTGAAAKGGLNREIRAAGWGQLLRFITYKAEEAGRDVIAVNPRHTSQTCHACGHVDAENRHATTFRCTSCGRADHADVNAARNILRAGLAHRHEREAVEHVA